MTIAEFKDLCLDAANPDVVGPFWAAVLGRTWKPAGEWGARVVGPTPQHTVWINQVPEPKTVKHRMHFDIYASEIADLEALGSSVVRPAGDERAWTVMADPEGGEYCAFLRAELPTERMHGLVVDAADPRALARWWADIFDATVVDDDRGLSTVTDVAGMPIATMDFVPVPEAKTVKNRIHPDVTVRDPQHLLNAGATLLRAQGDDIHWHVMADPEGNEFCAFVEDSAS